MNALAGTDTEVVATPPGPRLACGYELLGAGVAAGLSIWAFVLRDGPATTALNVLAPMILGLALGFGILRTIVVHRLAIWLPTLWFRITAIPFYVIGGLSPFLVDERASAYLQAFAPLDPPTIAKVNVAVIGGICLVILCFFFVRLPRTDDMSIRISLESGETTVLMYTFLVIGGFIHYGVEVPQALHLVEGRSLLPVVPFAFLFQLGFLILVTRMLFRRGYIFWLVAALFLVDTLIASLSMMKLQIIQNLVLIFIAALTVRCSIPRFIAGSILLVVAFVAITGVIDNARAIAAGFYQSGQHYEHWGSPVARAGAIAESILGEGDHRQFDRVQSLLVRLCYTPLIAAAMAFRDSGVAHLGTDFWLWSWVPRILYPPKPSIDFGGPFYTLLSGKTLTWMSPTFFGDAYWHASWAGIYLWMVAYGIALAMWARFTNFVIGSGRMLYIPIAFMGFRFAGAHYGFLVSHFTAFMSQALHLGLGLYWVQAIMRKIAGLLESRRTRSSGCYDSNEKFG